MRLILSLLTIISLSFAGGLSPKAQKNIDKLFKKYEKAGGKDFSAKRGQEAWSKEQRIVDKDGKTEMLSCKKCHTTDLTKATKHYKTGKDIRPISPSTNPEAFAKYRHTKKWFRRNCKQVYKRECTPQEKGDFLKFMIGE